MSCQKNYNPYEKSILVTWGIWRKVMTLLYYAFIGDMETMCTQAYA